MRNWKLFTSREIYAYVQRPLCFLIHNCIIDAYPSFLFSFSIEKSPMLISLSNIIYRSFFLTSAEKLTQNESKEKRLNNHDKFVNITFDQFVRSIRANCTTDLYATQNLCIGQENAIVWKKTTSHSVDSTLDYHCQVIIVHAITQFR